MAGWKVPKWGCKKIKIPALGLGCRLLLYTAALLASAFSLVNVVCHILPSFAEGLCYGLAACILTAACCYLVRDIRCGVREKIRPGVEANPFLSRLTGDYRYRTILSAGLGLSLNLAFALFNGAVGVVSRSPWFGTLSVYYLLLGLMRFRLVRYDRSISAHGSAGREMASVCRSCGWLFVPMALVLGGAVILLVHEEGGKSYPGFTIYAVAAYTFYKITLSVINVVKAGRMNTQLLLLIRNIGYVDACVSLLSLQSALLSEFGKGQEDFGRLMNGITGAIVCLMVLGVGIGCICGQPAGKREKRESRW